jgi:hypothetical protein
MKENVRGVRNKKRKKRLKKWTQSYCDQILRRVSNIDQMGINQLHLCYLDGKNVKVKNDK